MVRKAGREDCGAIAAIYDAIHTAEERGEMTIGWQRGVYPTRATAEAAIRAGEMYVLEEDGAVVAAGLLNQKQVPEYALVDWQIKSAEEEVLVLHTLVVDPAKTGRGHAKTFVAFYNELARERKCKALRIDTNERNAVARNMYARLGFREAGIVPCVFNGISGVQLVCLERAVARGGKDPA